MIIGFGRFLDHILRIERDMDGVKTVPAGSVEINGDRRGPIDRHERKKLGPAQRDNLVIGRFGICLNRYIVSVVSAGIPDDGLDRHDVSALGRWKGERDIRSSEGHVGFQGDKHADRRRGFVRAVRPTAVRQLVRGYVLQGGLKLERLSLAACQKGIESIHGVMNG